MKLGFGQAFALLGIGAAILLFVAMITTFERPPVQTVQRGFRGMAMGADYNPREVQTYLAANKIPATLPQLPASGPKAGTVYKNVQVLQNLSVGQFTRLMASITNWVAPTQGCAYCHNTNNMAEDSVYTKVVARRMIQMVQHINADWKPHVARSRRDLLHLPPRQSGAERSLVHTRGTRPQFNGMAETNTGKNLATAAIGNSSLPYDPFTPFLEGDANIRVQSEQALPGTDNSTIKQTDWTYALMIHFSQSLGRELHLLPQQPRVRGLGAEHAAAGDRVAWHPDGARPEQRLPEIAAGRVPAGAARPDRGRGQARLARPATRACSSRFTA